VRIDGDEGVIDQGVSPIPNSRSGASGAKNKLIVWLLNCENVVIINRQDKIPSFDADIFKRPTSLNPRYLYTVMSFGWPAVEPCTNGGF
jgi:hypothetical protein